MKTIIRMRWLVYVVQLLITVNILYIYCRPIGNYPKSKCFNNYDRETLNVKYFYYHLHI